MRAFMSSILKCCKCKSEEIQRINPREIRKTSIPEVCPSIKEFREQRDYLFDLLESLNKSKNDLEVNEADLYEFFEDPNSSDDKIKILLYGIEIVNGSVTCSSCGNEKKIENGILFCE